MSKSISIAFLVSSVFSVLSLAQTSAQELRYCSAIQATTELIAINDTELRAGSSRHDLTLVNNKVAVIKIFNDLPTTDTTTGVTQNQTWVTSYAAPVRLVRESLVVDYNRAIKLDHKIHLDGMIGSQEEVGPLTFTKKGVYVIRETVRILGQGETPTSQDLPPRKLELLSPSGESKRIGNVVISELNQHDPNSLVIKMDSGEFNTINLRTGELTAFENNQIIEILEQGYQGVVSAQNKQTIFFPKIFNPADWNEFYILNSSQSPVPQKTKARFHFVGSTTHLQFESGISIPFTEGYEWSSAWSIPADGNFNFYNTPTTHLQLSKNGQKIGLPFPIVSEGQGIFTESNSSHQYASIKQHSSQKHYLISAAKINCSVKPSSIQIEANSVSATTVLQKLGGLAACSNLKDDLKSYDAAVGLTPESVLAKNQITTFEADYLLQRFLRQDHLSKQDKIALELITRSESGKPFSNLIHLILTKFELRKMHSSLQSLTLFRPSIKALTGSLTGVCLSPAVRNIVSGAFKEQIMTKLQSDKKNNSSGFNIQNLLFIKAYLPLLSEQHKVDIASDAGTLLAEASVAADPELRNVFFSTLDWMATQNAREVLGLKSSKLTDFITSANLFSGGYANATILATKDIMANEDMIQNTSRRARGGFYTMSSYIMHQNHGTQFDPNLKTVRWYVDQKPFEVDLHKITRPLEFKPTLPSEPNREELLADNILYGMVVIGANIRGDTLVGVKEHYLYYLETQGFEFYEETIEEDALKFIEDRINGRVEKLDYFLKEAHSDGDYRNLFSINKKMHRIRAERQGENHMDIIDLVFHDDSYNPVFITNQEFGNWLKTRETEKNAGQFIYLNTSCSSYMKAAAELGTAASPNLVIIASATSVYTFSASDTNSTYHLFEGMLNLTPFDQIIERNKGLDGEYIFPHQERYKELVLSRINAGFDLISKIYRLAEDGTRTLFQIEQEINQTH